MADEPIITQSTPRCRARDLAEGPLGPDDLITIGNVGRLVTQEMIYNVYPEITVVGGNPRLFKLVARRSHIRVMKDCTFGAMIAAVPEGFPIDRPGEIDFGAIDTGSHAAIVPHGEGPSSTPSPLSHIGWLPRTDREAELHAQILQKDHSIEDLLLVVNGLREDLDAERLDRVDMIAELDEAEDRRLVNAGRDKEITVDNYVHANVPPAHPKGPVQPEVQPEVQVEAEGNAGPPLTRAQELAAARGKVTELQAEVAQLKTTADVLEAERRCNFVDGSIRAVWDLERAEVERRIKLLTRELDHGIRVYEERHRALETDIAERMKSVTPEELNPETQRATWEMLQRYDTSVQSLSRIRTAAHQLVTKKYRNRQYDPVQLKGADLKMVVMRGNNAMWHPSKREEWNRINETSDLRAIRHFFPGWAPLKEADGGTVGLSEIWHQAVCQMTMKRSSRAQSGIVYLTVETLF
ncbi:hypothetical protein R1sor_022214 [Riccia sorocarpa]|uniref:Uncharacterized protein n=1 Tax=Riccia sorocarpa TaxID=122646 RepID=A0ABD3GJ84_9MARC